MKVLRLVDVVEAEQSVGRVDAETKAERRSIGRCDLNTHY
jgi:hypothetical protein